MTWCDKLASTPAVGFKLDAHVAPGDSLLQCLAPILSKQFEDETPSFQVDKHDSLSFGFNTNDGFKYGLGPTRVHVTFNHRIRARQVSRGAPTMELMSEPKPYTELLTTVCDKLIEATRLLPNIDNRNIVRVGVISLTHVDEGDMPPGIGKLIDYMGRPWGGSLPTFDINVTSTLSSNDEQSDRCIHILKRPEDPDELSVIQFDWQRHYYKGRSASKSSLEEILAEAAEASQGYFEELAEGALFDDELINSKSST